MLTHLYLLETQKKAIMSPRSDKARLRPLNGARTRFSWVLAVAAIMVAMNVSAQRIQVVDNDGFGIPLVTILTEDGNMIGTTNLDGVFEDLKGVGRVTLTHVTFKPQTVSVANLTDGRITMEDNDYNLAEIVVRPKSYIYVETLYRVYVYRNDSLCYFLSGIMPNAYDPQKKKLEHGSYMQAYIEYCSKTGAAITWGARAQRFNAGIPSGGLPTKQQMKDKYFVTTDDSNPNHWVFSNQEGKVGQFVRSGSQARQTLDGGRMQMYANKAKGQTRMLKKRQEVGYEYQYTRIYANNEEGEFDRTNFVMDTDHWEYNDKKDHVKFIIENYAADHGYMDKNEWKAKKKGIKTDYKSSMTIDQLTTYEQQHNIPALPATVRQAIQQLKHI